MSTTDSRNDQSTATAEHPSASRLREGFAAFGRGDLERVRERLADDATWVVAGNSPMSGTYRGWDEILGMFATLMERTGGTFTMNMLGCLGDDTRAVAIYDATATVADRTATHRFVMVEDLIGDGRAEHIMTLAYDQAASDAHLNGVPQQR